MVLGVIFQSLLYSTEIPQIGGLDPLSSLRDLILKFDSGGGGGLWGWGGGEIPATDCGTRLL